MEIIMSYLIGSIPFGLIVGRQKGVDLRTEGSGNIGATNAWRVLGKKYGIIVFILDYLKGVIAVSLFSNMYAGLAVIIGHAKPIWLKFEGGKAVATGLGVISVLMPKAALIGLITWVIIVVATRYVSVGSIISAVVIAISGVLLKYEAWPIGVIASGIVIIRHRSNIWRLIRGTERKV